MTDDKLVAKLARACVGIGNFQADKRNTQQNYNYISADQVLSRVGAALAGEGLMIVPAISEEVMEVVNPKPNQVRYDALVTLEMTITDGTSSMVQNWLGRGSDYGVPDKALYKAITSGHKYFLMKLFNIGVGNDDSEHDAEQPQPRVQARPPQVQNTGPLPDDEQVIADGAAIDFWADAIGLIDRYTVVQHAQAAAKKLGFKAVPKSAAKRLEMYRALRDYAATRDAEEVEARDSKLAEQGELFEDELTGGAFAE